jgi:alpha-glucosidase
VNGPSPVEVSKQYSSLAGNPASVPYWGLGLHQCRYGYRDVIDVAEVIANYSAAGIPLETQWADIDYMDKRAIFTTNPDLWPVEKMTDIVQHLHSRDQHFIVMVDPAMAALPADEYPSLARSEEQNVLLKNEDGSAYTGVVWPGATVFPDWSHPNTTAWWVDEFQRFFTEDTIDISGVWLDMNEVGESTAIAAPAELTIFLCRPRASCRTLRPTASVSPWSRTCRRRRPPCAHSPARSTASRSGRSARRRLAARPTLRSAAR